MTAHKDAARDKALREAYSIATKQLRENHQQEFNDLRAAASERLGVTWEPRPTKEQKAEADLLALLDAHPALVDRLAERINSTNVDNSGQGQQSRQGPRGTPVI